MFERAGLNPVIGARLLVIGALVLSASGIYRISRQLHASSSVAWVSVFAALSLPELTEWSVQIRPDFFALACTLLGVGLFLQRRDASIVLIGCICGTALLFKQTYIAGPLAMVLWCAYQRRWADALRFVAGTVAIATAGNAISAWREPAMLEHLAALRQPVFDYRGVAPIVLVGLATAGLPLGGAGMFVALRRRERTRSRVVAVLRPELADSIPHHRPGRRCRQLLLGATVYHSSLLWARCGYDRSADSFAGCAFTIRSGRRMRHRDTWPADVDDCGNGNRVFLQPPHAGA